nr:MAG TPA: hypothetical protein [Caudoviricetes sp.]
MQYGSCTYSVSFTAIQQWRLLNRWCRFLLLSNIIIIM